MHELKLFCAIDENSTTIPKGNIWHPDTQWKGKQWLVSLKSAFIAKTKSFLICDLKSLISLKKDTFSFLDSCFSRTIPSTWDVSDWLGSCSWISFLSDLNWFSACCFHCEMPLTCIHLMFAFIGSSYPKVTSLFSSLLQNLRDRNTSCKLPWMRVHRVCMGSTTPLWTLDFQVG